MRSDDPNPNPNPNPTPNPTLTPNLHQVQQLAATVKPVLGAVCASLFLAPTLTEHQGLP